MQTPHLGFGVSEQACGLLQLRVHMGSNLIAVQQMTVVITDKPLGGGLSSEPKTIHLVTPT